MTTSLETFQNQPGNDSDRRRIIQGSQRRKAMRWVRVESSTLRGVAYDSDSSTLELEFSDGDRYRYFEVPEAVYSELLAADSKGNFFHTHVKGTYRFTKL